MVFIEDLRCMPVRPTSPNPRGGRYARACPSHVTCVCTSRRTLDSYYCIVAIPATHDYDAFIETCKRYSSEMLSEHADEAMASQCYVTLEKPGLGRPMKRGRLFSRIYTERRRLYLRCRGIVRLTYGVLHALWVPPLSATCTKC